MPLDRTAARFVHRHWLLVAVLAVALLLAGCADDDSEGAVATLDDDDTEEASSDEEETADTSERSAEEAAEVAMLEYSECMRDQGFDFPPPGTQPDTELLEELASEEGQEANAACEHHFEDVADMIEFTPEEQAEMRENTLLLAQCMRDEGYDVPDPTFGPDGMPEDHTPQEVVSEEGFMTTMQACAEEIVPEAFEGS